MKRFMEQKNNNHGGARIGAGRPSTNRVPVTIRLSKEILECLPKNKSEYINEILKKHFNI